MNKPTNVVKSYDDIVTGANGEKIPLDESQIRAIQLCCDMENRLAAVSGHPGTGKTTITQAVFRLLTYAGYRVAIAAPTGKAAKRIKEATGIDAMTIHRLLEYPFPGERDEEGKALTPGMPRRSKRFPLEQNVVLVDEYAMVNTELHRNIMNAMPPGGVVRCFGDIDQLQPIEPHRRLGDKSPFVNVIEKFPSVRLTKIHRQEEGSGILTNALMIREGKVPRKNNDFGIVMTPDPVGLLKRVLDERDVPFNDIDNQIITPTVKTWVGTAKLNALLQSHYITDAHAPTTSLPRHPWAPVKALRIFEGDKVIWTENDYNLLVFNGETGKVVHIASDDSIIVIDFGDRIVEIPQEMALLDAEENRVRVYSPWKSIDLAYAITTHKAQGSEFDHVVYVLNKSSRFIQCRPNLYTAVTRAKKKVLLVTDPPSLAYSATSVLSPMDRRELLK